MKKTTAIKLLGGSPAVAARRLKVSRQAVWKWPDVLSPLIQERVRKAALEYERETKALRKLKGAA